MPPSSRTAGRGFERIVVAWDRGREAARAVGEAVPYLYEARLLYDQLAIEDNASKIVLANTSREDLKSMPEFHYTNREHRRIRSYSGVKSRSVT